MKHLYYINENKIERSLEKYELEEIFYPLSDDYSVNIISYKDMDYMLKWKILIELNKKNDIKELDNSEISWTKYYFDYKIANEPFTYKDIEYDEDIKNNEKFKFNIKNIKDEIEKTREMYSKNLKILEKQEIMMDDFLKIIQIFERFILPRLKPHYTKILSEIKMNWNFKGIEILLYND